MVDVESLIAEAIAKTDAWAAKAGWPQTAPQPAQLSEAAERVRLALSTLSFGCQQDNVRKLLSALLDEEIPAPETAEWAPKGKRFDPPVGVYITVNGETGRVREVDSDRDVFADGISGYSSPGAYRPATAEEVRAAVEKRFTQFVETI